uniref:Uncharacterized protein n=1 Tax=Glossina pallidipes TaxID=7398 RepID=A0A1A9ZMH0_GLOPL
MRNCAKCGKRYHTDCTKISLEEYVMLIANSKLSFSYSHCLDVSQVAEQITETSTEGFRSFVITFGKVEMKLEGKINSQICVNDLQATMKVMEYELEKNPILGNNAEPIFSML